jgi:hypothetical protein
MGIGSGWYYNDVSGDVVHASAFTSIGEGIVPGWHGPYATQALAIAHKGTVGATAKANETVPGSVAAAGGNAASNGLLPSGLFTRALWLRIAEGALGAALILVGVAKLAEGTPTAAAIRKVPIF